MIFGILLVVGLGWLLVGFFCGCLCWFGFEFCVFVVLLPVGWLLGVDCYGVGCCILRFGLFGVICVGFVY